MEKIKYKYQSGFWDLLWKIHFPLVLFYNLLFPLHPLFYCLLLCYSFLLSKIAFFSWFLFDRSEERNIFQRTVLFCAGNLESAQILGPGIWNHRNYHHRNNCYKLGSLALICPSARSMRVHIFTEVNILYGIGKMWKKP